MAVGKEDGGNKRPMQRNVSNGGEEDVKDIRVVELSHLRKTVYHIVGSWPGKIERIVIWPWMDICGRVLDNKIAIFLLPVSEISIH